MDGTDELFPPVCHSQSTLYLPEINDMTKLMIVTKSFLQPAMYEVKAKEQNCIILIQQATIGKKVVETLS